MGSGSLGGASVLMQSEVVAQGWSPLCGGVWVTFSRSDTRERAGLARPLTQKPAQPIFRVPGGREAGRVGAAPRFMC